MSEPIDLDVNALSEHDAEIITDREFQVIGPPGTGKTTYLARQVRRAVAARGAENVVIASFTNAAAAEIGSRDLSGLPVDRVGTLHSHAYRSIGKPKVADSAINEFLDWQKQTLGGVMVDLSVSGRRALVDHATGTIYETGAAADPDVAIVQQEEKEKHRVTTDTGQESGLTPERAYALYQLYRAKMRPRAGWPASVLRFARIWEQWKADSHYIDFTDMIERALHDVNTAPGNPSIGFFDESQDFTPLQLALVRKWGAHMDRFIVAGDDDQVLYSFTGATPGTFARPVPDGHRQVLPRSYRVPARVLAFADAWVKRLGPRRTPKIYEPRHVITGTDSAGKPIWGESIEQGEVYLDGKTSWLRPDSMLPRIADYVARGESVMILASASYMLDPTISMLRDEGIPFHNPYRVTNGLWNPLQRTRGMRTADRVLAFFRPDPNVWGDDSSPWTAADLRAWTELVRAKGLLVRGGKKAIDNLDIDGPVPESTLLALFEQPALIDLISAPKDALIAQLADGKAKTVMYPLAILERLGRVGIESSPLVTVGTIHSVKGGEADHVFVFPDISRMAGEALMTGSPEDRLDASDALTRQFYVAITRAKYTVTITTSYGGDSVPLARYAMAGSAA